MDPLDVSQGQNLINSVTGKISNKNVNVEDAVQIGEARLQEFEPSHMILPNDQEEGYYHEGRHEEARSGHKGTV